MKYRKLPSGLGYRMVHVYSYMYFIDQLYETNKYKSLYIKYNYFYRVVIATRINQVLLTTLWFTPSILFQIIRIALGRIEKYKPEIDNNQILRMSDLVILFNVVHNSKPAP